MEPGEYDKISGSGCHHFCQGTVDTYYLVWGVQLDMDSHFNNLEEAQEKVRGFDIIDNTIFADIVLLLS